MIAVGRARAPQLVQIAGVAARGRKQHVARSRRFPHRADHFALRRLAGIVQMEQTVDLRFPFGLQLCVFSGIFRATL